MVSEAIPVVATVNPSITSSSMQFLNETSLFPADDVNKSREAWSDDTQGADAHEGLLSDQAFRVIENFLDCGCRPLLFFIGAPTNLLNLVIFYRQGLRDRMNLCLFSLAVVDLLYVTSKFIMASYCFTGSSDGGWLREVWKFTVRKYVVNFVFGTLYCSGCLTMIIAVERCLCVVFPMKAATLMRTRTMAVLILLAIAVINALCAVYALKYDVKVMDGVLTEEFVVMLKASPTYKRHKFAIDVIENIVLSAVTFVNFTVVSVATCITVIKLRDAMTWRQTSGNVTSAERRQVTLVRMLVTLSCIYIICMTPTICLALTRMLVSSFWANSRYGRMYFITHIAATVFLMINSSTNFFVYITQSSRFRAELRALCCGKKPNAGKLRDNSGCGRTPPNSVGVKNDVSLSSSAAQ